MTLWLGRSLPWEAALLLQGTMLPTCLVTLAGARPRTSVAPLRALPLPRAARRCRWPVFLSYRELRRVRELPQGEVGGYVVHRKVVAEQANMRLGTAMAKTRSRCVGWPQAHKQKGTAAFAGFLAPPLLGRW